MMHSPVSAIIVNADDFGLSRDTNAAICELAKLGALSSTSLMANLPDVGEATALHNYPELGIGVHINLTAGSPLTQAPTLTAADGKFYLFPELVRRLRAGKVNAGEVRAEIQAQIMRSHDLVGGQLDHWNSHQGIHRYEPVASVAIDIGRQLRLEGMRGHQHFFVQVARPLIAERPDLRYGVTRLIRETYYTFLSLRGRRHFAVPHGLLSKLRGTTLEVMSLLAEYGAPTGTMTWELPCHPATSEAGLSEQERKIARVSEYEYLRSSAWLEAIKQGRVRLATFGELRRA